MAAASGREGGGVFFGGGGARCWKGWRRCEGKGTRSPRQRFVRRSSRFFRPFLTTTPNNNNESSTNSCSVLTRRLLPKYVDVDVWNSDSRGNRVWTR